MMRVQIQALPLVFFLLFPRVGQAIITTNNAVAEQTPSGLNWDYVFNCNASSSVGVDEYWTLTAAHVADDANCNLTIGTTTYYQQEIVYHDTADLALVRYDKALPGYYDIYTGSYPTQPNQKLDGIMVGYGVTGTVVDPNNYSFVWDDPSRGTKRWGSNRIDGELPYTGSTGKDNSGLLMYFNTPDSIHEAGAGTGDSGGGLFVEDGGTWKLAGIMTDVSTGGSQDAVYSVDAQDYQTWITETIPEPSVLAFGFIVPVAFYIRRVFLI